MPSRTATSARRRRLAWLAVLGIAAAVRLPSVTAGYPYLNYVDEGHVLHRVVHVLRSGDWDPGWYIYGALPNYAILGAVYLYSPIYRLAHGRWLSDDLPVNRIRYYDRVGPPELLVLGRLVGLLVSVATVALTGWLAARLAGAAAGLLAAWLAALLPALVIGGAVINVDVYATFFVLAALCFAERLRQPDAFSEADRESGMGAAPRDPGSRGGSVADPANGDASHDEAEQVARSAAAAPQPPHDGRRAAGNGLGSLADAVASPGDGNGAARREAGADTRDIRSTAAALHPAREGRRAAILAGAMTGFALVSKYPQVLVALAVTAAVLLAPRAEAGWLGWLEKLRRLALAGGAAVLAAALGMPALVLRTGQVIKAVAYEASLYAGTGWGSYWDQAVRRAEWDQPLAYPELGWPFLLLAAVALAAALADRRRRGAVLVWGVYAAALGLLLSRYGFRPFRNVLSLVPLLAVLVGCLYGRLRCLSHLRSLSRLPRPRGVVARPAARRWLDAAAVALPLALFAAPVASYVRHQLTLVDSRRQAALWLAAHAAPGDVTLLAQELAFLPSETQKLPGKTREFPWPRSLLAVTRHCCRFVVLGDFLTLPELKPVPPEVWRDEILPRYEVRAAYGEDGPNGQAEYTFHGNRQRLVVLERREHQPRR